MSKPHIPTSLSEEKHPRWYYDIPVMKTLLLGNFPPHKSRHSFNFYYPNKQNNFWKILAKIAGAELQHYTGAPAVAERQQLMRQLKVGVENLGQVIVRKGTSALDADIKLIRFRNIARILRSHPELETVLTAGYSAGSSTFNSFTRYLEANKIAFERPTAVKPGARFKLFFGDREISCYILNSTSTATRIKLDDLVEQYKPYIAL